MERYCPPGTACFVPANKILPKFKRVARKFSFAEIIFCKGKKIFCDFSFFMEPENGKTKSVNENENKNVDEFKKYILQQKLANTKVKTQSDMKAW